ncbi:ethanolamine ammonia-lyase [Marinilongibacter aquaticus]|uniref:ethanolamine ammonia-lyase n=1 Tax=Marinilongibacter aquaticus TaxID=2975157 RepID=UPI0021BD383A|nr:ethanolamine ammonia-lyase [Marinilongibacter aquaticus]UBM59278.1 ethanolamine ammonia-lyase [Marinilongibacter aquaticus]
MLLLKSCSLKYEQGENALGNVKLAKPKTGEDIFAYIKRQKGEFDTILYRQILGAANSFKEGDQTLGLTADSEESRKHARELIGNTPIKGIQNQPVFQDELLELIQKTTRDIENGSLNQWTFSDLKTFVLNEPEDKIKAIMPYLGSDAIACVVKLMDNEELIQLGQKVFNPLPNSKIGSKGYMSARVQPNSPTDNVDDIRWQVFDAWSYAVGDLVLGTNPVSSEPESVAAIENTLFDIIQTFGLEKTISNCVLSHIDVQAEVEKKQPGSTGIWFQSLAGTVSANETFDLSIEKMQNHASQRNGQFGLYAETGQGADFTNGHGEGFDMLMHESRKYGFLRALKQEMTAGQTFEQQAWVHVNDVAGFIGPEVFKTKEQLVRCCLEDIAMGKLHGLTIGLDICSTLHMDVSLDDLDWCIDHIMPANPAYLMALPTKNDPMLSYLTTAFSDHVRVREKFGYKINDAMWDFFKHIEIIDSDNKPTEHFGDPIWVYYQYQKSKGDERNQADIYAEGRQMIETIKARGVAIAEGYGENYWDLEPELNKQVHRLYEDAKTSLWTEMDAQFLASIPNVQFIVSQSQNRKDYVYHPESGEKLSQEALSTLKSLKAQNGTKANVQIIISDGLNARAIMDEGHLKPFLSTLKSHLQENNFNLSSENIIIKNGRVRTGYACGELLFGEENKGTVTGIIHVIGERPGSGHHNFSAYLTATTAANWHTKGKVDHNITRVVSGISDTALKPEQAASDAFKIFSQLFEKAQPQA